METHQVPDDNAIEWVLQVFIQKLDRRQLR
jgi:hypothetical protein